MEQLDIISYCVKLSQHIILIHPETIEPDSMGSGCIVKYRNRTFLLTAAHVTDEPGLQASIRTGHPPVNNKMPLYAMGEVNYIDEYRIINLSEFLDAPDIEQMDLQKVETIDFSFVEVTEEISLVQDELDFGEDYGCVKKGPKIFLNEPEFEISPTSDSEYLFFGNINGSISGNTMSFQAKLTVGMKYVSTFGRYHRFRLPKKIMSAVEFKGTSGAPIVDVDGHLVGLVSHCIIGLPFIYAITAQEIKKHLDCYLDSHP